MSIRRGTYRVESAYVEVLPQSDGSLSIRIGSPSLSASTIFSRRAQILINNPQHARDLAAALALAFSSDASGAVPNVNRK